MWCQRLAWMPPAAVSKISSPAPMREVGVELKRMWPLEWSHRAYSRFSQPPVQSGVLPFHRMFCHWRGYPSVRIQALTDRPRSECRLVELGMLT